jgi:hypothetical protein
MNLDFLGAIQRVTGPANQRFQISNAKPRVDIESFIDYSAAAANFGFMFADDTMKSEMRGTISDLKREPLNTP